TTLIYKSQQLLPSFYCTYPIFCQLNNQLLLKQLEPSPAHRFTECIVPRSLYLPQATAFLLRKRRAAAGVRLKPFDIAVRIKKPRNEARGISRCQDIADFDSLDIKTPE